MSEKFKYRRFKRMQLTPEMLAHYDVVVNIADRDQTPDWLRGDNVIWWNIPDLGIEYANEENVQRNFELIAAKVHALIDLEKSGGDTHGLDDNIDEEQD